MSPPRSPFDDDSESTVDEPRKPTWPPERKWSFVALGIVLFVFTWIRELTGLPAHLTLTISALILCFWAVAHACLYTRLPELLGGAGTTYPADKSTILRDIRFRLCGAVLLVFAGIFLQVLARHSFQSLTVLVLFATEIILMGTLFMVSRELRRVASDDVLETSPKATPPAANIDQNAKSP